MKDPSIVLRNCASEYATGQTARNGTVPQIRPHNRYPHDKLRLHRSIECNGPSRNRSQITRNSPSGSSHVQVLRGEVRTPQ